MSRVPTYVFLHTSQLYNSLVDGAFGNQAVHRDLSSLSQPVGAVHCLCVVGWIPAVVIENDSVCGSQVDTQTTRTGTKQEDEDIRPIITLRVGRRKHQNERTNRVCQSMTISPRSSNFDEPSKRIYLY